MGCHFFLPFFGGGCRGIIARQILGRASFELESAFLAHVIP